ncbi:MAG: DUF4147 domain-containing protein, partial [Acidobacteria bacterium]
MPAEGRGPGDVPAPSAVRRRDRPVGLVRSQEGQLTPPRDRHRLELHSIFHAALEAVSTARLVEQAVAAAGVSAVLAERPCRLVAAGKASPFMAAAFVESTRAPILEGIVVGTHCPVTLRSPLEWIPSSHPVPDHRSAEAGAHALLVARRTLPDELLVVLLSGGASSLLASPRPGVSLEDKRETTRRLLLDGADIGELNVVRKHLSG